MWEESRTKRSRCWKRSGADSSSWGHQALVSKSRDGLSPGLAPCHSVCPSPRPRGQTSGDRAQGSRLDHSEDVPPSPRKTPSQLPALDSPASPQPPAHSPAPGHETLGQSRAGLNSGRPVPCLTVRVCAALTQGQSAAPGQPSPHLQVLQVCVLQLLGSCEDLQPRRTRCGRGCDDKEMLGRPGQGRILRWTVGLRM